MDFVSSENIGPRIWPRSLGAAERLWNNPQTLHKELLQKRYFKQFKRLQVMKITVSNYVTENAVKYLGCLVLGLLCYLLYLNRGKFKL